MLIVAAFALLVVCVGLLFFTARKMRWLLSVAGLLVGAGALFAVQTLATNREAKRLHESLTDSCQYLASELNTIVWDYQSATIAKASRVESPVDIVRVRLQYEKIRASSRVWLDACLPDAMSRLPTELDERTVDRVQHAAAEIGRNADGDHESAIE